jgi:hypothetical protein
MRRTWHHCATACLASCLAAGPYVAAGQSAGQDIQRRALTAALESLIATGEPRHVTHDEGQWLQLAIDDAIARGDREIEMLAIRAASPLTASISRPVSSARDLPAISFDASAVLRVKRAIPYTARVFASIDGGELVAVRALRSGRGEGGRVDTGLSDAAARPGFHVVRLRAELTFGTGADGAPSWTESRILQPLVYAVYDPVADSGAAIRALVYGPASTPVRELDPLLGDEPFAAWLSGLLSSRRGDRDSGPDWMSQYCDERTGEAGTKSAPTAICAVVYFQSRGEIGQIWFRTADIREAEHGIEWVPAAPPRFEGLVVLQSAPESQRLSSLPSLLDTAAPSRPVGDISVARQAHLANSPTLTSPAMTLTVGARALALGRRRRLLSVIRRRERRLGMYPAVLMAFADEAQIFEEIARAGQPAGRTRRRDDQELRPLEVVS